jgi:prefoldin subunit 5
MRLLSWWQIGRRIERLETASDYLPNNYARLLRRLEKLEDEVDKLQKFIMPAQYPRS